MHAGQTPRLLRGAPPVQHAGYLPRKTDVIDLEFDSFNLSFLLSGSGFFAVDGKRVTVTAPCVLTQWEGPHFHYGQDDRGGGWEELFFIYPSESRADFERRGLWRPERPWWPIAREVVTRRLADEVLELMRASRPVEVIDLIDRLAEAMVVASLGARLHIREAQDERALHIGRLRERLAQSPCEPVDWTARAAACGCSLSTFRRLWMDQVGIPPARYVMQLRIQEAARLLLETNVPVAEVAAAIGVEDPLYFSRLFRQQTGEAPSIYRQRKRMLLAGMSSSFRDETS